MNGAPASLASRRAISVLPTPVGPIIRMFFGSTSSRSEPVSCSLRQRLRNAMETARLASAWPTMKRSSSETISRGEKSVMSPRPGWKFGQASELDGRRGRCFRCCGDGSCAADHQERRAVGGIDQAILAESGLLVSSYRTRIGRVRIDHHTRNAVREQLLGEAANECRAMTALQHVDRKSTRLNSSHGYISYAVFC